MDAGWLQKQGNSIRKGWRPRWFWADHEAHCLHYAEKQGEKPLGTIPFATAQAKVNNSSSKPYAIDFVTPTRTYYVACKSQEEQLAWIDLFRRCIKSAIDGTPVAPPNTGITSSDPARASTSSPSVAANSAPTSPRTNSPASPSSTTSQETPPPQTPSSPRQAPSIGGPPRPVLERVMSAWNFTKANCERGVLYIQDSFTLQYQHKIAEVRGDNLFLYSSETKAAQRRNSSSSIILTMCQVRPGRMPPPVEGEAPVVDDLPLRLFSLVTPTSTFYFMGETMDETTRWIRVFQQIQRLTKERARADTVLNRSLKMQSGGMNVTVSQPSEPPSPRPPTPSHVESELTKSPSNPTIQPPQEKSEPSSPAPNGTAPLASSDAPVRSPSSNNLQQIDILLKEVPTIGEEALDESTRRILDIARKSENRHCADCREENPEWASINLGIFICLECSGIHRSLGVHISKVRSVDLDIWDDSVIDFMASMGNEKSNAIYEAELSVAAPKPTSTRAEKDVFVKAKYQYKQYTAGAAAAAANKASNRGLTSRASAILAAMVFHEGFLDISSESDKSWRHRFVVLKENKLLIFKARADPDPRSIVPLSNAHVKSTTLDRISTFELVIPGDVLYCSADNSSDFFNWMEQIRTSQKLSKASLVHSQSSRALNASPVAADGSVHGATTEHHHSEQIQSSDAEVVRSGWLYKRGGKVKNWKKRWFVLKDNKLTYYASKTDKQPKGSIAMAVAIPKGGEHEPGTAIKGISDQDYRHTFEIVVVSRVYYMAATSNVETQAWLAALKQSKRNHEARVALSKETAKQAELALSSPERAIKAIPGAKVGDSAH